MKWRRKERDLKAQIRRLRQTVDKYKQELEKLKEDCYVSVFLNIREKANEKDLQASILLEQIQNFQKKKPAWTEMTVRHAVILRNLSTRAYEHMRTEGILRLPCRSTLERFMGSSRGEVGVTDLVKQRLRAELSSYTSSQSRTSSLIIDEMRVKQRLLYVKQRDAFIGEVDYGQGVPVETTDEPVLANSLLCFILSGLSTSFRIPVAYFFTKNCKGRELHLLMRQVLKEVEAVGFVVVRVVTDNHRINVMAFQLLCNGTLTHVLPHPENPDRKLFLAFDQCHLIKNVRSQFLARDLGKDGGITAEHVKNLYRMQQDSIVKPVRFLTRKHVFPSNLEKMNVRRAVQLLSPAVTAALKLFKQQAGHTCDASFLDVDETVQFMDTVHRWFLLMDVSNCSQHIHQNNPDCRQFDSESDERLEWLETTFIDYLSTMKRQCLAKNFLTKETYQGLVMTTHSNVECVKYLLTESNFLFVLTRKMSSDPIESFFGWLRRSAGSNDQTDARAVLSGIEKMLKTGIASKSDCSNVVSVDNSSSLSTMLRDQTTMAEQAAGHFPREALTMLSENLNEDKALLPTPDIAALAMVGGYLARAIGERTSCEECLSLLTKPSSSAPSDALIKHQDRGGLLYPSGELLHVLYSLRRYIEVVLAKKRNLKRPLKEAVDNAAKVLRERNLLVCTVPGHHEKLVDVLLTKFFRPIFTNFAMKVTDKHDFVRIFEVKPLSRKVLKL
ncbi:uncharacterized protein LOC115332258 [Ixodes scapularis]|uniref:uncharacterized protein LOC115332258 n=1 Tax=Ixodes scapularis TaxID=6945 RepID=UPI001A9F4520|nr:uncharacterized protein LOC115332258 [Ixodes scapularis]